MKISVLTTVYNRPEHLRLLLASLAAQTRRPMRSSWRTTALRRRRPQSTSASLPPARFPRGRCGRSATATGSPRRATGPSPRPQATICCFWIATWRSARCRGGARAAGGAAPLVVRPSGLLDRATQALVRRPARAQEADWEVACGRPTAANWNWRPTVRPPRRVSALASGPAAQAQAPGLSFLVVPRGYGSA